MYVTATNFRRGLHCKPVISGRPLVAPTVVHNKHLNRNLALDNIYFYGIIIKPHIMGSKKYVYVFAYRSETYEGENYYVRSYRNRW